MPRTANHLSMTVTPWTAKTPNMKGSMHRTAHNLSRIKLPATAKMPIMMKSLQQTANHLSTTNVSTTSTMRSCHGNASLAFMLPSISHYLSLSTSGIFVMNLGPTTSCDCTVESLKE